jgi:hypothetical protein
MEGYCSVCAEFCFVETGRQINRNMSLDSRQLFVVLPVVYPKTNNIVMFLKQLYFTFSLFDDAVNSSEYSLFGSMLDEE